MRPARPLSGRAAPTVAGATPLAEGSVRARGEVCFHTPSPRPSGGRSRSNDPSGKGVERRIRAADPLADRLAGGCSASPRMTGPRPRRDSLFGLPARDCWLGETPAAAGRMGLSGSILPDADRGTAERGVSPIHGQGARIGIGAPPDVAQPKARQRLGRPGPCPAERPFRVRPPPKCAGQLWIGTGSVEIRLGIMAFRSNIDKRRTVAGPIAADPVPDRPKPSSNSVFQPGHDHERAGGRGRGGGVRW